MTGESNLTILLRSMKPYLNDGDYVFCALPPSAVIPEEAICFFKEQEAVTVIIGKDIADKLQLNYSFIAAWISLTVHSSLNAVGLTAAISTALAENGISCNVVAAYYHDHLFVDKKDAQPAMKILTGLSKLH